MYKLEQSEREKILEKAIEDARKAQEYYLTQVEEVNKTLAKYNKKIDELEKKGM